MYSLKNTSRFSRKLLKLLAVTISVVASATLIRMFVIDLYEVPSNSMVRSIIPGDYILVSKITYGPRWPECPAEIPWFNFLALSDHFSPWFRQTKWKYKRWPKRESINENDIVVFNSPLDQSVYFAKRCKGLPGQAITITNDDLFINGRLSTEPEGVNYTYVSKSCCSHELNVQGPRRDIPDNNNVVLNFTTQEYEYVLHPMIAKRINSINHEQMLVLKPTGERVDSAFGPILVPKKGATINVSKFKAGIYLYKHAIETFEGGTLQYCGDIMTINGKTDSLFTFENDYYFFLGDNRHSSRDSREWGFVPERNVIGKAILILFSDEQKLTERALMTLE